MTPVYMADGFITSSLQHCSKATRCAQERPFLKKKKIHTRVFFKKFIRDELNAESLLGEGKAILIILGWNH
jgi:hypothetical protein